MLTPLLLIAALALVQISQSGSLPIGHQASWAHFLACLLLLILTDRYARRLAQQDPQQENRLSIGQLDFLTQTTALAIFGLWVLNSNWVAQQHWTILCLAPLLVLQLLLWLSLARCMGQKRLRERWALVSIRLRFELLPLLILVFSLDLVRNALRLDILAELPELAAEIIGFTAVLLLLCFLPLILVRLWSCSRIQSPAFLDLVQDACALSKTKVTKFYTWPTRRFPFYNAMAMGLISPLRVVIISEDLVLNLEPDEVKAVIGHELGHLHHRHLILYMLLLLSLSLCAGRIAQLSEPLWAHLFTTEIVEGVGLLLQITLILLGIRTIFGLVSRACERQADLHGAQVAGFQPMQNALRKVSALMGQDLDTPNWRHHSIAQRVNFLETQAHNPYIHRQHQTYIMRISTLIVIALLTILTMSIWQTSQSITLQLLREQDPQLNTALEAALNLQSDELLSAWLADQNDFERQFYVRAAKTHVFAPSAEPLSESEQNQLCYDNRYLFTPFLRISTGNSNQDIEIDNMLAYAIVVCAKSADEKLAGESILKQIMPRLEVSNNTEPDPQIEDTIGCIAFVTGDYAKALVYFKRAQEHLKALKVDAKRQKERDAFSLLLEKRIEAATLQTNVLPLEGDAEIVAPPESSKVY